MTAVVIIIEELTDKFGRDGHIGGSVTMILPQPALKQCVAIVTALTKWVKVSEKRNCFR